MERDMNGFLVNVSILRIMLSILSHNIDNFLYPYKNKCDCLS